MWLPFGLSLLSLATATELAESICSSTVYVTKTATAPAVSNASSPTSASGRTITVATDASGQFTGIDEAIAYAQSHQVPTVTVLAGTYPAVTVSATPAVAVIGQSNSKNVYSENEVVVSSTGKVLTISVDVTQITFKNVNFVNKASADAAAMIRGGKNGFYQCRFVSSGSGIVAELGLAVIANSYIEASENMISGAGTMYIYNTAIVPTNSSATITFNEGHVLGNTLYNSTVIIDHSTVYSESREGVESAYLAAAKDPGSVVVFRSSSLDKSIASTGIRLDTVTSNEQNFYGEYENIGPGAYPNNDADRYKYVSLLDRSELARYTLQAVLAGAYPTFATSSTLWIDPAVLAAIENPSDGQYPNITSAIAAIPDDGKDYIIFVERGTYLENIVINREGKLTIRGETSFENDSTRNRVTISFSSGASTNSEEDDDDAPVLDIEDAGGKTSVALYNLNFHNTHPQSPNTSTLAATISGTVAAYGCSFIGYQNTLFANNGVQVFSNFYIEGALDFVWGYSMAYFHQTYIATNTAGGSIVAQGRESERTGGYVFDTCVVTYTDSYGTQYQETYLGRPLSEFGLVVFRGSYLDKQINPTGWSVWSEESPRTDHVTFGEFNNSGPGRWNEKRVAFATQLTAEEAEAYTVSNWIGDTSWLDMAAYSLIPSYNLGGPSPTGADTAVSSGTSTSTSHLSHPKTAQTPPEGAVSVSVDGSVEGTFESLTDALASLPGDSSPQVIFMYAGSYEELVPPINRTGPVSIIGYTEGDVGRNFADNTVTLTFSHGIPTSPLPNGHTENETATISTISDQIAVYNIHIVNTKNPENQDGSYANLAASLFGTHIAFYGCSFVAWQNTLLTGSPDGYMYFESTYIEGAIDTIWGYSKAYFKGCTIGAKIKGAVLTAQGRAPPAIGGYIFDQCYFGAASASSGNITSSV
ncbi:Pectinesterase catalytic [Penicillium nucicola]|uniref:Pectinesterase catalytic n=1 Tax=Penicillium nucicola TaxID=1850975 RepID=UPI002545590C|nr:Pectinesterase catalytic [Penicillium nucicola]KAJ5757281.1 Pectinesterase catalytic [Penicillium nucicola]